MAKHDDGGPAKDMSLRAYYAGEAMKGYCANPKYVGNAFEDRASDAFDEADAMIAALEREEERDTDAEPECLNCGYRLDAIQREKK